jgi:hypothetical protein
MGKDLLLLDPRHSDISFGVLDVHALLGGLWFHVEEFLKHGGIWRLFRL